MFLTNSLWRICLSLADWLEIRQAEVGRRTWRAEGTSGARGGAWDMLGGLLVTGTGRMRVVGTAREDRESSSVWGQGTSQGSLDERLTKGLFCNVQVAESQPWLYFHLVSPKSLSGVFFCQTTALS